MKISRLTLGMICILAAMLFLTRSARPDDQMNRLRDLAIQSRLANGLPAEEPGRAEYNARRDAFMRSCNVYGPTTYSPLRFRTTPKDNSLMEFIFHFNMERAYDRPRTFRYIK